MSSIETQRSLESVQEVADVLRGVIDAAVENMQKRKTRNLRTTIAGQITEIPESKTKGMIVRDGLEALNNIKIDGMTSQDAMNAALILIFGEKQSIPDEVGDRNVYIVEGCFVFQGKIPSVQIGKVEPPIQALELLAKASDDAQHAAHVQAAMTATNTPSYVTWHAGTSDMTYMSNIFGIGYVPEGLKVHLLEIPTIDIFDEESASTAQPADPETHRQVLDIIPIELPETVEDTALRMYQEMLWFFKDHGKVMEAMLHGLLMFAANPRAISENFSESFPGLSPKVFIEATRYAIAHQDRMRELAMAEGVTTKINVQLAERFGLGKRVAETLADQNVDFDLTGKEVD